VAIISGYSVTRQQGRGGGYLKRWPKPRVQRVERGEGVLAAGAAIGVNPLVSTVSRHSRFLALCCPRICGHPRVFDHQIVNYMLLCFIVVKNAKYYAYKCAKSFSIWGPRSPDLVPELCPRTRGLSTSDPLAPLAALSGSEFLCFSLPFCFSNKLIRVTASVAHQTRTDSWLDDTDKHFGPNLPLLFKIYEIWSVDSLENF